MNDMLLGGILSSLSTGAGALAILFFRSLSHRSMDILLALTAGIMVAASTFGLIPFALELSNLYVMCTGVIFGAVTLSLLEEYVPHVELEHSSRGLDLDAKSYMLLIALTLHNIPEGLSVGLSYATQDESLGPVVAFSIGLQNAPEGLLIALFLYNQNVPRLYAILIAALTGSIELFASFLGFYLTTSASRIVPYGLAFAAGAMLFIVYKELIPETHGHGHERVATLSFIVGLLMMICLMYWVNAVS